MGWKQHRYAFVCLPIAPFYPQPLNLAVLFRSWPQEHLQRIELCEDFVRNLLQLQNNHNMRVRQLPKQHAAIELDLEMVPRAEKQLHTLKAKLASHGKPTSPPLASVMPSRFCA